jgi:hypothetical protein
VQVRKKTDNAMDYWKQGKIKIHLLSIEQEIKEYFVSSLYFGKQKLISFPCS